jgi:type III secretion protein T
MTLSIDWLREVLTVPVLTMARLAACLVVAPFFSNQFITGTVRNGIILSLTLVVYPMVSPAFAAQVPSLPQAAIILIKEVFLGIVIGFLSGAPFWIASSVGFIVDTQRGTGMGEIFDPNLGTQTSPLGAMLSQVIVTLFYVSGGLFLFL